MVSCTPSYGGRVSKGQCRAVGTAAEKGRAETTSMLRLPLAVSMQQQAAEEAAGGHFLSLTLALAPEATVGEEPAVKR